LADFTGYKRPFNFCDKLSNRGAFVPIAQYVAYSRVCTVCQGQSGLGPEAQQAAGQNFLRGAATLVATLPEMERGKKNERPQLQAAIAQARQEDAVLPVATLSRLTREGASWWPFYSSQPAGAQLAT
jgi:DNA invertase Pin-like site-specific DNA recombinase